MSAHAYRTTRKPGRSDATRERIKAAVRELLAEGTFHTSTVEHVADRAGISRATLYQHFRSRLELVDAICENFDANPALLELRQIVELPDAEAALDKTIANCIRFWSSEDAVLHQERLSIGPVLSRQIRVESFQIAVGGRGRLLETG